MTAAPSCPRCGYDLSGAVASWNRDDSPSCPLRGTCSECGLDLAWGLLLNTNSATLPWLFEHALERRAAALRVTHRRAFRPAAFFREVGIERPVRAGRLVVFALLCMLALHITAGICSAVAAYVFMARIRAPGAPFPFPWDLTPGATLDLVRLTVFPYLPFSASWFVDVVFTRYVFGFVSLWPLLTAQPFLVLGATLSRCHVRRVHLLRGLAYSLVFLPIPGAITIAGTLFSSLGGVWGWRVPGTPVNYHLTAITLHTGAIALQGAWLARYWWIFCTRYLRLPHSFGVVVAMLLIGALSALAALLLISWGDIVIEAGTWMGVRQ